MLPFSVADFDPRRSATAERLEGGYAPATLGECVLATFSALM